MKVFNLKCSQGHSFEGWFSSVEACDQQQTRGQIQCPICETASVQRMPTAAHVSTRGPSDSPRAEPSVLSPNEQTLLREKIMALAKSLAEQADDVGRDFPEEARRIHYREAPERMIMGEATPQETKELLEEGIGVLALPITRRRKKGELQ